jgi:Mg/Co/Ni transporter MgtE
MDYTHSQRVLQACKLLEPLQASSQRVLYIVTMEPDNTINVLTDLPADMLNQVIQHLAKNQPRENKGIITPGQ